MFLTPEELRTLTGTPLRTRQIAVLRREGIRFTLDCRGRPVVTRAAVERPEAAEPAQEPEEYTINVDACRRRNGPSQAAR